MTGTKTCLHDEPDLKDRMNTAAARRRGDVQALLYAGVLRIACLEAQGTRAERGLIHVALKLEDLQFEIRCYQVGRDHAQAEYEKRKSDREELIARRMGVWKEGE